jgi:hypothetical protein
MSSVFYKFSAHKTFSTITFDGVGVTLKELKQKIAEANRLTGDGSLDLLIFNAQTGEGTTFLNLSLTSISKTY